MAKTATIEYIECKTYVRGSSKYEWVTSGDHFAKVGLLYEYDLETGSAMYTQYTSCIHFKTPVFDGKSSSISITVPFSKELQAYVSLSTSAFDTAYTYISTGTPSYSSLSSTLTCELHVTSSPYKTFTIDCTVLESDTDYYLYFSPYGALDYDSSTWATLSNVGSQTNGIITYAPPFGAIQLFQSGSSAVPYLPHIYIDGEWKQCSPYVYSNGAWHECER